MLCLFYRQKNNNMEITYMAENRESTDIQPRRHQSRPCLL